MMITVQDFSGVYAEQPFMQGLRESAGKFSAGLNAEIRWMDCTGIPGTDCYCDDEAVTQVRKQIAAAGIKSPRGIHFFDNGNYHYMSKIWTDMVQEPFSLVVFDHHPDMQEPRFGNILSCGGWVLEVLKSNPFVQGVTLIGVADHLVDEIRQEISQTEDAQVLDKVAFVKESDIAGKEIPASAGMTIKGAKLYFSIDKDALATAYAATNWDQGSLSTEMLKNSIAGLAACHKILGVDICGERARDFAGNEHHTVQEADALNSELNRELAEFLLKIC